MPSTFRTTISSFIYHFPRLRRTLKVVLTAIGYDKGTGEFKSTGDYWDSRYRRGGNSGAGSYGRLAEFKAEAVNRFVRENHILSVVEFGCGDGAQLELAQYPRYTGM